MLELILDKLRTLGVGYAQGASGKSAYVEGKMATLREEEDRSSVQVNTSPEHWAYDRFVRWRNGRKVKTEEEADALASDCHEAKVAGEASRK